MADFNITVDTHPMARSLDSVNSNVQGVTNSVIAMESAVVLAQNEASERICQNVDTGFYLLMKSQFDQKIADVSSVMLSKKQLLETFKNDVERIMLVMNDDYDRIKLRYTKQFSALDKALETRIHELDKRAYELSRNYKMSEFKNGSEVIKTISYSDETQILNVQEVNATIKKRSSKAINVMADDVLEQLTYSKSVKNILTESDLTNLSEEYVPVIFTEADSMIDSSTQIKNMYPPENAAFASEPKFLNNLREDSEDFSWQEVDSESHEKVKNFFLERVNSSVSDERVAKEMVRLFGESTWAQTEGA